VIAQGSIMEKDQLDFHISEYTALRSEITSNLQQANNAIIYSLVANSAVFWWVKLQTSVDIFVIIASFLPLIITLLSFGKYTESVNGVLRIAEYCKKLEKIIAHQQLGWETHLASIRSSKRNRIKLSATKSVFILQFLLSIFLIYRTIVNEIHR
jgi:hypothetical protein